MGENLTTNSNSNTNTKLYMNVYLIGSNILTFYLHISNSKKLKELKKYINIKTLETDKLNISLNSYFDELEKNEENYYYNRNVLIVKNKDLSVPEVELILKRNYFNILLLLLVENNSNDIRLKLIQKNILILIQD